MQGVRVVRKRGYRGYRINCSPWRPGLAGCSGRLRLARRVLTRPVCFDSTRRGPIRVARHGHSEARLASASTNLTRATIHGLMGSTPPPPPPADQKPDQRLDMLDQIWKVPDCASPLQNAETNHPGVRSQPALLSIRGIEFQHLNETSSGLELFACQTRSIRFIIL